MKVVIIEDEKFAAERIISMLSEIEPGIEVMANLTSVEESVKWLRENKPDVIFLDIQLSDGISFTIFDEIKTDTPVVFTTAYDEYAVKAFKLNSIDYLLKPIRKSDLAQSIEKYRRIKPEIKIDYSELLKQIIPGTANYKKRFLVQYGQKIKKVETEEVAYFYALEKNVFMVTDSNQTYPVDYTLDKLQEILSPDDFFRINRKIIVSFNAIKNMVPYSRSRVKIELEPPAPRDVDPLVSIERAPDFKKWLDK